MAFGFVAGYALIMAGFSAAVILLGYLIIQLAFLTMNQPSVLVLTADVVVLATLIFVLSRKKVRDGFKSFWKQILRNM